MSRAQVVAMLERSILEGWIDEDQALELLARYDAGEIAVGRLPLAIEEALGALGDAAVAAAFLALVRWLLANDYSRLVYGTRVAAAHALADQFTADMRALAARLTATGDVQAWERAALDRLREHYLQMGMLVDNQIPAEGDVALLAAVVREQEIAFVRFAEEVVVRDLLGEALSAAQIGARAVLYGGAALSVFWLLTVNREAEEEDLIYYEARDDGHTCGPCIEAERASPYRASEPHPVPGSVCEGGGFCRCRLRIVRGRARSSR